jgi:hypothetical protein
MGNSDSLIAELSTEETTDPLLAESDELEGWKEE